MFGTERGKGGKKGTNDSESVGKSCGREQKKAGTNACMKSKSCLASFGQGVDLRNVRSAEQLPLRSRQNR